MTVDCVGFEGLPLGQTYQVGDTFTNSGVTVTVQQFMLRKGNPATGHAEVENGGAAGGSGLELEVNNVNLDFNFGAVISVLTLRFGEHGGNLNLDVNGDFHNFKNFQDLNNAIVGGVAVSVTNGGGNDQGILTLNGPIKSFVIGGQELWIDDVCAGTGMRCVDFESLALGQTYQVGDSFTDSGVTAAVEPFAWAGGGTTSGGYAQVEDRAAAGGSGQELQVNNVNLAFDFGGPIDSLTLRFGEYGGNLNIEINGDARNFRDFQDINNDVIGGVAVAVTNGLGNDQGTLTLKGVIKSFSIGGQELWIDEVCDAAT
jgi:hypothetical protein